jgi:hypothetical protein
MTRTFFEAVLFASLALNAGLLLFFSGVFRQMMNAVDEAAFKNLIALLFRYSTRSPFMIIGLNLPLIAAIPYYCFYGFSNWWITSGIIVWLAGGSLSKILKLPVYKALAGLSAEDPVRIREARAKFNRGNILQALLYTAAVFVMAWGIRK